MCFFVKQKTAYEVRISDWSSDVCASDLLDDLRFGVAERRENFVAVRAKLRCRLRWQRRAIELDRHADHVEAAHAGVDDALHETIGLNLAIVLEFADMLDHIPLAILGAESFAPVGERASGEQAIDRTSTRLNSSH